MIALREGEKVFRWRSKEKRQAESREQGEENKRFEEGEEKKVIEPISVACSF